MKGLIFTQFLTMVEEKYDEEMVDKIILGAKLANDGAYSAIGTYDHEDLIKLITELSKNTGISASDLEIIYGKYLFNFFITHYHHFVKDTNSTFELLENVDSYIHVEVRKLHPDAELPRFIHKYLNTNEMILDYESVRPFADFAQGLILGCAEHFGENIIINRETLFMNNKKVIRFYLKKQSEG